MATPTAGFWGWINKRYPLEATLEKHITKYYAPKNFNFLYMMGFLAMVVLVLQLMSGIFLTMNYKPDADLAFASVEYIMRDVDMGWLIRYLHSTGASAFFVVVYIHIFRGLLYGSYKDPRELLWIVGMLIFVILMAEAFFGYMLPWGQMSYWGGQVIVNLVQSIPIIGTDLAEWVRGDFVISDITLNRFFALHVIALPLALVGVVFVHIVALHQVGSNNPDGIEIKDNKDAAGIPVDGIPFHPYITSKDMVGLFIFLIIFCAVLFYAPEGGGYFLEAPNFIEANPLKTPEHIAPVWYFTPFYAMLRAIPSMFNSQFPGTFVMGAAVMIWFILPWLDKSPVKSMRYKGVLSRIFLFLLVISFFVLGVLGTLSPTPFRTTIAQVCTVVYFSYFMLMPLYTRIESHQTPPARLT